MNIIPISSYPYQTSSVPGTAKADSSSQNPFRSMFDSAVSEFKDANAQKESDSMALALGEDVDLITMQANAVKAETSLQLLVQMRNKLLDSYQEIMRLNI